MRSSTVVALFAGSAAAQSTAVVFNPLMPASTLTVIGSSSGTTTYVNSCSDGGIPASWLSSATAASSGSAKVSSAASAASSAVHSAAGTLVMTPISAPSTTAAARLRRQDDGLFGGFCEPITLKQGSSSIELHLEDPTKGVWTADFNCVWKGELTAADLTCTATQTGAFASINEGEGVTSEVIKASDVAEASLIQTVSVVSASPTASGSQSGSASGSAKATTSGSGAPAQATGAAAGAPLSKGVMAFVGGAAGVFAAALAL